MFYSVLYSNKRCTFRTESEHELKSRTGRMLIILIILIIIAMIVNIIVIILIIIAIIVIITASIVIVIVTTIRFRILFLQTLAWLLLCSR